MCSVRGTRAGGSPGPTRSGCDTVGTYRLSQLNSSLAGPFKLGRHPAQSWSLPGRPGPRRLATYSEPAPRSGGVRSCNNEEAFHSSVACGNRNTFRRYVLRIQHCVSMLQTKDPVPIEGNVWLFFTLGKDFPRSVEFQNELKDPPQEWCQSLQSARNPCGKISIKSE